MLHQVAALKAMLLYDWFLKYYPMLIKLKKLPQDHKLLLNSISKYYEEYGSKTITIDELEAYFHFQNPSIKSPEAFEIIFRQFRSIDIPNEQLVQDILSRVLEIHYCMMIAEKAESVMQNQEVTAMDEIENLVELFRNEVGKIDPIESEYCSLSLEELIEDEVTGGTDWHLDFLNNTVGPLKEGTLGHIFARPNAGKTSFGINIACNAAWKYQQANEEGKILYLCNEEKVNSLKLRAYTAFCQRSFQWITQNPDTAKRIWETHGGDRIIMVDEVHHIAQVEKHIRYCTPRITIIDQGPKVAIFNKELIGPERKQQLYNMYREKAKKYNTSLITLGQADEKADNRKILKLDNIDGSKVGIPGELDWALGIGYLEKNNDVRYFNIAKKKRGAFGNSPIGFDEVTGKFSELE